MIWNASLRAHCARLYACASVAGIALPLASAWAAPPAPTPESKAESSQIGGDIIVTARKREERLQDVPVAVTALQPEQLKAIDDPYDLASSVAGLTVTSTGNRNGAAYTIRGQFTGFNFPPGVLTYFADAPRAAAGSFQIYDLASVQVLKGPQGTLFGRSATGGAILFGPQRPTDEFEGHLKVGIGNYENRELTGALNIPIVDGLAIRLAGNIQRRDGYTRAITSGRDLDNRHRHSFRIGVLLKPFDWFENYFVFQDDNVDEHASSVSLLGLNLNLPLLNTSATGAGRATIGAICDGTNPGDMAAAASCIATRIARIEALKAGLLAEEARLAAGGSRRRTESVLPGLSHQPGFRIHTQSIVNDTRLNLGDSPVGDLSLRNIVSLTRYLANSVSFNNAPTIYPHAITYQGFTKVNGVTDDPNSASRSGFDDNLTEEVQVAGDVPGGHHWVIGYYYEHTKRPLTYPPYFPVYNNAFTVPLDFDTPIANFTRNSSIKQTGVFGQGTVDLSGLLPGLRLTAGYRHSTFSTRSTVYNRMISPDGDVLPGNTVLLTNQLSQGVDSYTFTGDYRASRNLMLYATTRKAFKNGGINNVSLPGAVAQFKPEIVKDVEIGLKSSWSAGVVRGRVDIAAYYQWYSDVQRIQPIIAGTQTANQTNNIADARIKGFEAESQITIADRLKLAVSYAYIDAGYRNYLGTTTDLNGVVFSNSDTPYPNTPKHQVMIDAAYDIPLSDESLLRPSAKFSYRSGHTLDDLSPLVDPLRRGYQKGYSLLDLRLDWERALGSPVELSVFARNITNRLYKQGVVNLLASLGTISAIYNEPRTYGVEMRVRFGPGR